MNYLTMICDIKNSKKVENRQALQYQLIDLLKRTNNVFKDDIVSSFIITMGDEWQGLLKESADFHKILHYFHEALGCIDFYCGMGIGPITIYDFELTVNQLDGPSFYLARKAIQMAKDSNYSIVLLK